MKTTGQGHWHLPATKLAFAFEKHLPEIFRRLCAPAFTWESVMSRCVGSGGPIGSAVGRIRQRWRLWPPVSVHGVEWTSMKNGGMALHIRRNAVLDFSESRDRPIAEISPRFFFADTKTEVDQNFASMGQFLAERMAALAPINHIGVVAIFLNAGLAMEIGAWLFLIRKGG